MLTRNKSQICCELATIFKIVDRPRLSQKDCRIDDTDFRDAHKTLTDFVGLNDRFQSYILFSDFDIEEYYCVVEAPDELPHNS